MSTLTARLAEIRTSAHTSVASGFATPSATTAAALVNVAVWWSMFFGIPVTTVIADIRSLTATPVGASMTDRFGVSPGSVSNALLNRPTLTAGVVVRVEAECRSGTSRADPS